MRRLTNEPSPHGLLPDHPSCLQRCTGQTPPQFPYGKAGHELEPPGAPTSFLMHAAGLRRQLGSVYHQDPSERAHEIGEIVPLIARPESGLSGPQVSYRFSLRWGQVLRPVFAQHCPLVLSQSSRNPSHLCPLSISEAGTYQWCQPGRQCVPPSPSITQPS